MKYLSLQKGKWPQCARNADLVNGMVYNRALVATSPKEVVGKKASYFSSANTSAFVPKAWVARICTIDRVTFYMPIILINTLACWCSPKMYASL